MRSEETRCENIFSLNVIIVISFASQCSKPLRKKDKTKNKLVYDQISVHFFLTDVSMTKVSRTEVFITAKITHIQCLECSFVAVIKRFNLKD